jgi:hypothetical protein
MERVLTAPLSPHEEITLRRIALGISKAKLLLVREGLPRPAGWALEDEAVLRSHLRQGRDR